MILLDTNVVLDIIQRRESHHMTKQRLMIVTSSPR